MTDNGRGAALMVAAMAAFTLNDACLKAAGADLALGQMLLLRGLLACALVGAFAWRSGALRLPERARDRRIIAGRSLAEVAAAGFFLSALMRMPLANVTAILQTVPLAVVLVAALVLKEPVGWRRWTAVALGFAGMVLIVRPGTDGFSVWGLSALVAVGCVTVRDLLVRRLSRDVPSLTVTFAGALAVTVAAGLASIFEVWHPLTLRHAVQLTASGVLVSGAYALSVATMRVGDMSVVAPFRYTGLLWALGLGWVAFGDWPTPLTFVGAGLIAATGVFTLWRSAAVGRATPVAPGLGGDAGTVPPAERDG